MTVKLEKRVARLVERIQGGERISMFDAAAFLELSVGEFVELWRNYISPALAAAKRARSLH